LRRALAISVSGWVWAYGGVAGEGVGGVELGDGDVEAYGDPVCDGDGYAHLAAGALPFLAGAVEVPGAAHEHVGDEDEVAGEVEEEPFAAGLDAFDGAAGEGLVVVDAG
jgi:hypothetical protein